jgi:hypothetical protein
MGCEDREDLHHVASVAYGFNGARFGRRDHLKGDI